MIEFHSLCPPVNPAEAEALRGVTAELIEIADQLAFSVMAQAAEVFHWGECLEFWLFVLLRTTYHVYV